MTKKKILVIDDDQDILLELQEFLSSLDLACECVGNVSDALEHLAKDPAVDLIITDLRMPEQSGLRLIQQLNEHAEHARIPVIVTSGHADVDDVIALFRYGAVDFLPKPIYYQHFIGLLQRIFPDQQIS